MSTEESWQDTEAEDTELADQRGPADETDVDGDVGGGLELDAEAGVGLEADADQAVADVLGPKSDQVQPARPEPGAESWTGDWSDTPVAGQARTTFDVTGEEPVDRALAELDGIDDLALSEHGAAYERAHRRLQEALSEVDGEADAMAGTS